MPRGGLPLEIKTSVSGAEQRELSVPARIAFGLHLDLSHCEDPGLLTREAVAAKRAIGKAGRIVYTRRSDRAEWDEMR